jgi:IS30 family transposase
MLEIALQKEDVTMKTSPHLSQEERTLLSHYHDNGRALREISRALGRSASTLFTELKRNANSLDYNQKPHQSVILHAARAEAS